jgi:YqaJ-like viral recombinase domain
VKIIDCQQGTAAWFAARIGIPTASCADKIITPKTGKLSAQSRAYGFKLLAERLLHRPTETMDGQHWMERGKIGEGTAVKQLEFELEIETRTVGFITTDDGRIGASPDRLVVDRPVGAEIKVPAAWTHLQYLLDGHDEKYTPQVQCQCLVAEFDEVIFYSWSERMPPALIRTARNPAYIAQLRGALNEFCDGLDSLEERARELGTFQQYEQIVDPSEAALEDGLRREPLMPEEELAAMLERDAGFDFDHRMGA